MNIKQIFFNVFLKLYLNMTVYIKEFLILSPAIKLKNITSFDIFLHE